MSSKQDRHGARTAADLEYKYNFGKSFAEVYNLIADVQKGSENAVNDLDAKLDPEEIFNRLTNYGKVQGIYRGEDGDVYVNATYIKSGKLAAEYIDADNLKVKAANITGTLKIESLPDDVAQVGDIPLNVSDLVNDVGYQNASGVTTIVGGVVTTDFVEALGIKVAAAKITGRLTANQIDATNLQVAAANVTGTLSASQITLTGAITWDDLDDGVQDEISDRGISSATAKTLITSTLVSSPTIRGGSFQDLNGDTKLTLDPTNGGYADLHLTNKSANHVFTINDNIGSATIKLYGMGVLTAGILATYPLGTWDFSNTEVIGVKATFG